MHRKYHQLNIKKVVIPILGIATSLGLSTLLPSQNVGATSYLDGSSVSIIISDDPSTAGAKNHELRPTSSQNAFAAFRKFVDIDVYGSENYSVFIRSSNEEENLAVQNDTWSENYDYGISATTGNLVGSKDGNDSVIAPLNNTEYRYGVSVTEFKVLPTSTWAYRYTSTKLNSNLIPDRDATNQQRLSSRNGVTVNLSDDDKYMGVDPGGIEKYLGRQKRDTDNEKNASERIVLEFAANVTPGLPNDIYTGYVTVGVVAEPYQVTLLSPLLKTMQDMTSDICSATPTPSNTAQYIVANRQPGLWDDTNGAWLDYERPYDDDDENYRFIGQPDNADNSMLYSIEDVGEGADYEGVDDSANPISANYVPETVLIDSRDGKPYLVRKLADGHCWMSSNLDYKLNANFAGHYNGKSDWNEPRENWNASLVVNADSAIGQIWDDGSIMRNISGKLSGYPFVAKQPLANETSSYDYEVATDGTMVDYRGTYYSWAAATLGTGLSLADDGESASSSVCPRGWRLPEEDWIALFSAYGLDLYSSGSKKMADFPLNYPRSGAYFEGEFKFAETNGLWWSSRAKTQNEAYGLNLSKTQANIYDHNYRVIGRSIRCIAR